MGYNYRDKKIVALLADDIEIWQAMNALGHMSLALGANKDTDLMGRGLLMDKTGGKHLGIARFGFVIKKANKDSIKRIIDAMKANLNVIVADFRKKCWIPATMMNWRKRLR